MEEGEAFPKWNVTFNLERFEVSIYMSKMIK
jgi:hypothetical protein